MNFDHSSNSFDSSLKVITCEPAILEQVLSVKIFRMKGFGSPVHNVGQLLTIVTGYVLLTTLSSHHVGDLNDRILVSLWKDTLSARAFDIKTDDAEGRNLGPFAFGWMRYKFIPPALP